MYNCVVRKIKLHTSVTEFEAAVAHLLSSCCLPLLQCLEVSIPETLNQLSSSWWHEGQWGKPRILLGSLELSPIGNWPQPLHRQYTYNRSNQSTTTWMMLTVCTSYFTTSRTSLSHRLTQLFIVTTAQDSNTDITQTDMYKRNNCKIKVGIPS